MYDHVNYLHELAEVFQKNPVSGVSKAMGKKGSSEDYAQMNDAMALSINNNGSLGYIALYSDTGAPIAVGQPASDYFIGANKLNACPLILIRGKGTNNANYLMWHLNFEHINPRSNNPNQNEIKTYLPRFAKEVQTQHPEYGISHFFTSENSEILVTNPSLLDQSKFNCSTKPNLLHLPGDLRIQSSGLEQSIRSYSIVFFPLNDILVLSGHNAEDDTPYFWVMKDPFSGKNEWLKIMPCKEVIDLAQTMLQDEANKNSTMSELMVILVDHLHPEQAPGADSNNNNNKI